LHGVIQKLQDQGIQTRPVWGLIHEQKPYRDCSAYRIERAKDYSSRIINIQCSTQLTVEELDYVAEKLQEILLG